MAVIESSKCPLRRTLHFKRFFLCFEAHRVEFLAGCIPFIGLDDTHLKRSYSDVLLIAIGMDANSEIYPFAVGVYEGDNNDSWS